MRLIRLFAALIAAVIVVDFAIMGWASIGPVASLLPALTGAVVMLARCWQDAGSGRRRQLLVLCSFVLSGGVAFSLVLSLLDRTQFQAALLGVLLVASGLLSSRAVAASRRRRQRSGIYAYYSV